MKIELDEKQLDSIAKAKISQLEKEKAKLEKQVIKLNQELNFLKQSMPSKEAAQKIKDTANLLLEQLETNYLVDTQFGL